MEINKQLFEDVLSGKLKGTFVLKKGNVYSSASLHRNYGKFRCTHPYMIGFVSYTPKGIFYIDGIKSNFDIIDFIPDTNMKENELTIEIPNDKIVDWEESKKQNKIVLKNKQLTYEDICKKLFNGKKYYTDSSGEIRSDNIIQYETDPNNAVTEHQLECIMAKNMLANTAKYLNDGWKPDKNDTGNFDAWVLYLTPNENYIGYVKISNYEDNSNVLFKSHKLAQQAIKILGEKIIKLALEPLGI